MNEDLIIQRWVEYSMCEYAMMAYVKSKSKSTSFHSFCERLRESFINDDLSKWERSTIFWIVNTTNKIYSFPDEEIGRILGTFLIDRKWEKYYNAIKLMEKVRFNITY